MKITQKKRVKKVKRESKVKKSKMLRLKEETSGRKKLILVKLIFSAPPSLPSTSLNPQPKPLLSKPALIKNLPPLKTASSKSSTQTIPKPHNKTATTQKNQGNLKIRKQGFSISPMIIFQLIMSQWKGSLIKGLLLSFSKSIKKRNNRLRMGKEGRERKTMLQRRRFR